MARMLDSHIGVRLIISGTVCDLEKPSTLLPQCAAACVSELLWAASPVTYSAVVFEDRKVGGWRDANNRKVKVWDFPGNYSHIIQL